MKSSRISPSEMSLLQHCIPCGAKCCCGRTLCTEEERSKIIELGGCDPFVKEKFYYYLDRGTCPLLKNGLCSVQEVKPFVCLIFPFFPLVIDGEVWLYCAVECPAEDYLTKKFIQNARILAQDFFSEFPVEDYAQYWKTHKVGDFDESKVTLKIRVFEELVFEPTRVRNRLLGYSRARVA